VTFGGFGTNPTGYTARYTLNGKTLSGQLVTTESGVSNANTFTFTLPFAAANTAKQYVKGFGTQAGGGQESLMVTNVNSNVVDVYRTSGTLTWATSGAKGLYVNFTIEIA